MDLSKYNSVLNKNQSNVIIFHCKKCNNDVCEKCWDIKRDACFDCYKMKKHANKSCKEYVSLFESYLCTKCLKSSIAKNVIPWHAMIVGTKNMIYVYIATKGMKHQIYQTCQIKSCM